MMIICRRLLRHGFHQLDSASVERRDTTYSAYSYGTLRMVVKVLIAQLSPLNIRPHAIGGKYLYSYSFLLRASEGAHSVWVKISCVQVMKLMNQIFSKGREYGNMLSYNIVLAHLRLHSGSFSIRLVQPVTSVCCTRCGWQLQAGYSYAC